MEPRQVIGEVLQQDIPAMPDDLPLGNISGWDSLRLLNAVLLIERLLGRELTEEEIENLNTVGDLRQILSRP